MLTVSINSRSMGQRVIFPVQTATINPHPSTSFYQFVIPQYGFVQLGGEIRLLNDEETANAYNSTSFL
jgi:hypothetical protein